MADVFISYARADAAAGTPGVAVPAWTGVDEVPGQGLRARRRVPTNEGGCCG